MNRLKSDILPRLFASENGLLSYLAHLIAKLAEHEPTTKMSSIALSIVIAPSLICGPDPLQDAALCLASGQKLPSAIIGSHEILEGDGTVVGMLVLWSENWKDLAS